MSARIFIGAVLGGPEVAESAAFTAIQKIRKVAKQLLGDKDVESDSGIDYVFHIAGSMMTPDYEGVRHAKFSKKARLLMIQAAVPENMVSSPEILPFICELMRQGVIEAEPIFEKAKIPFDAERYKRFIDDIERELGFRK